MTMPIMLKFPRHPLGLIDMPFAEFGSNWTMSCKVISNQSFGTFEPFPMTSQSFKSARNEFGQSHIARSHLHRPSKSTSDQLNQNLQPFNENDSKRAPCPTKLAQITFDQFQWYSDIFHAPFTNMSEFQPNHAIKTLKKPL